MKLKLQNNRPIKWYVRSYKEGVYSNKEGKGYFE